jgi:hypothetical protein
LKQPRTPQPTKPLPLQASGNGSIDTATLELLASWQIQDATTDPEQIQAAEQELADFKKALNDSRTVTGERTLFP